jgi:hypothetical protein
MPKSGMQQNYSARTFRFVLFLSASVVMLPAAADISRSVKAAFRGQIVVTKGDLPSGKNDRDTIAKIKATREQSLVGIPDGKVHQWNFHYSAFLRRNGARSLTLEFRNPKIKSQVSATKVIQGTDPTSDLLIGEISVSEDDGVKKGQQYILNLVHEKFGIMATAKIALR